jgi:ribonuclease G
MSKELVISATPHETRVAILEDGHLCEIYIEREKEFALVGSIYKGRVTRVLPGMQSAFVDIGRDTDAFLYVSDFLEHLEEYDHVPVEEDKVQRPAPVISQGSPAQGVSEQNLPPQSVGVLPGEAPAMPQNGGLELFAEGGQSASESETSTFPQSSGDSPVADNAFESQPGGENPSGSFSQEKEPSPAQELNATPVEPAPSLNRTPPSNQGYVRNDRPRNDRGGRGERGGYGGGFGQGRGGDRGRGGRGGRFRRGTGGHSGRPRGRDLPASKYASSNAPHSTYTPRDRQSESGPPADTLEPILLPGESLAKYRDRAPAPLVAPAPVQDIATDTNIHIEGAGVAELQSPIAEHGENPTTLPGSLYVPYEPTAEAKSEAGIEEALGETSREPRPSGHVHWPSQEPAEGTEDAPLLEGVSEEIVSRTNPPPVQAAHDEWIEFEPAPAQAEPTAAELTEEQARTLAESLAEAKHEEAQEEVEDGEAHPIGGADFAEAEADAAHAEADEIVAEENETQEAAEGIHASGDPSGSENLEMQSQDSSAIQPPIPQNSYRNDREPRSARMDDRRSARFQRPARRGGPRGGRPMRHGRPPERHGHSGHAPQRRPQLISEMLKANQEIIVQIAKEPLGKKGARITSHVALPGRFLVYMPTVNHIGVSRKINSAETRSRLRSIVGEYRSTFPGGFIVRTAAGNVTEQDLRSDIEYLGKMWHEICARSEQKKAPALLHRDLNLVERILRDYVNSDYSSIWIDNEEEFSKVIDFVSRFQPELANRVKLYTKETPIFEEFGIQQELDKAMRPKVWLKSGGYIVINHTEALVAIDVNTGKFVGRGSTRLEDTIVKTNVEAVKEIVRQIRLRDLGGIIVVDFIDMEERRNRDKVMHALDEELRADKAPSKVLSFNEFGLVAITRKRTKQALEKVLCQPCPYCTGSGMVKSLPTLCYEIQMEAKKMAGDLDATSITLRVHPEIAKALKTREAALIEDLENATHKSVIIQSDPTLHWEQYDIF